MGYTDVRSRDLKDALLAVFRNATAEEESFSTIVILRDGRLIPIQRTDNLPVDVVESVFDRAETLGVARVDLYRELQRIRGRPMLPSNP